MKTNSELHVTQRTILHTLQYATRARYSELQRTSGMESDVFKFHVRALRQKGLIFKSEDGLYELKVDGKAFVSRLSKQTGREIEQPKSSMLMVVRSGDYVLAHRRDREPFNGFWGIASAPVLRGIPITRSASRELKKQTGIEASFRVAGSYRVIDKNRRGNVLEDKIFTLMVADSDRLTPPHRWSGGLSEWVSIDVLLAKPRLFSITPAIFEMLAAHIPFREDVCVYDDADY